MLRIFFIFILYFLPNPTMLFGNQIQPLDVKEIAEGVYAHIGKHENFYENNNLGDIANLGFIIGDESIAVIDTGGSHQIGEAFRKAIKKVSKKPIKFLKERLYIDIII